MVKENPARTASNELGLFGRPAARGGRLHQRLQCPLRDGAARAEAA